MIDDVTSDNFDDFSMTLGKLGLGQETMDCALIELLKLSQSY